MSNGLINVFGTAITMKFLALTSKFTILLSLSTQSTLSKTTVLTSGGPSSSPGLGVTTVLVGTKGPSTRMSGISLSMDSKNKDILPFHPLKSVLSNMGGLVEEPLSGPDIRDIMKALKMRI